MMNLLKQLFWGLSYVAIFGMILQPVSQAKAQSQMVSHAGSFQKNFQQPFSASQGSSQKSIKTTQAKVESPEKLLSELTQEIYWELYDWNEKAITAYSPEQKEKVVRWLDKLDSQHREVMKGMDKFTEWIEEKKLADVIKQRQTDAIQHINREVAGLKTHLQQMGQATSRAATEQSLAASFKFFEGKQLKRKHQVFDGLSSVALTPDRIPAAKTAAEFSKYNLESHSKKWAKEKGKNKNFTDPALLSTSDEVVINDYINEKATELGNDPVKIYHWVRNNIEWLPSYGAVQASDITLGSGRGNAFDQASLLLALLRASNVPSRYAYGTIEVEIDKFTNWVGLTNPEAAITFAQYGGIPIASVIEGGVITKVQMEHIWVEAAIDFNPSRGARNITPDSWVSLDPSFKQYEVLTGLDPVAISGVDMEQLGNDFIASGTVNETEGWVQGFDPSILANAQEQMQQSLTTHINDNMTDPTVGEVVGGRRAIKQEFPVLPSSTLNRIITKASDFIQMPENMRPKYRLAFDKDITGQIVNPLELNFAQLNNHKLTLSFKPETAADELAMESLVPEGIVNVEDLPDGMPAHLIKVIPQVALNEVVIKQGVPMNLGYDLSLYYQIQLPNQGTLNKHYFLPAGSYVNLMMGAGSVSKKIIFEYMNGFETTKTILENNLNVKDISSEEMFGDIFSFGGKSYLMQLEGFSNYTSKNNNAKYGMSPVFGTYGFEPNSRYIFGMPINVNTGGVAFNVYTTRLLHSNNEGLTLLKHLNLKIGSITSALEHSVSENLFSDGTNKLGVSAVRLIKQALGSDQKILNLNMNNIEDISNLNFNQETINEISQAIVAGYNVITHTDNVTIEGWSGAGYLIINSDTGDGAFKISGGSNGGFFIFIIFITLYAIFLWFIVAPVFIGASIITIFSSIVAALSLISLHDGISNADTEAELNIVLISGALSALGLYFPNTSLVDDIPELFLVSIVSLMAGLGIDTIAEELQGD